MLHSWKARNISRKGKKVTYVDEAIVEKETEDRCTRSRLAVNGRFNG